MKININNIGWVDFDKFTEVQSNAGWDWETSTYPMYKKMFSNARDFEKACYKQFCKALHEYIQPIIIKLGWGGKETTAYMDAYMCEMGMDIVALYQKELNIQVKY